MELFVTYVLILTVYAAAADDDNEVRGSPPLAIGLAIAIGHLFAVRIIVIFHGFSKIVRIIQIKLFLWLKRYSFLSGTLYRTEYESSKKFWPCIGGKCMGWTLGKYRVNALFT